MIERLRRQIILTIMVISSIALVVIIGLLYFIAYRGFERESIRMMRSIASESPDYINTLQKGRQDTTRLPYFILYLEEDDIISAKGGGFFDLSDDDLLVDLVDQVLAGQKKNGIISEYDLRYYYRPAEEEGLSRIVFADMSSELRSLHRLLLTSLLILTIALFVFYLISRKLANILVRPLELTLERQKEFVSNASHDLKTPLTVIMANTDLLKDSLIGKPNVREQEKFVSNIQIASRQMRSLTESLLTLASSEAGLVSGEKTKQDLSQIVRDVSLSFEAVFFEASRSLKTEITDGLHVKGNQEEMEQVLHILLDNAVKYSHENTETSLQLARDNGHALLTVTSIGAPLSKEELHHVFSRFYRSDKVRHTNDGHGLGLPIARNLVHGHEGVIQAESKDGETVFSVRLPLYS